MDLQLKDKIALVTGASMGIGKGIAHALAREGVDVAICARRKEALEAAAEEIRRASGRRVLAIPADLTKREDAETFVASVARQLGRIDILVNNAGSAPGGVLEALDEDAWMQGLQLKFMGYVRCLRAALPRAAQHSAGAHRGSRGGREPRCGSRVAARALRERHDDRDRRRPAEATDGRGARLT